MLNLIIVSLVIAIYLGVVVAVKEGYLSLPSNAWEFEGIFLLYKTKSGLQLIEKIAHKYKRRWRSLGTIGAITGTVILLVGSVFIVFSAIMVVLNPPQQQQITSPTNYLVIPGVNDFLPLSVGWEILIGLLIGMVVHEGGHAILSRVEDIELDSTGLVFFSILPIGAFVEPDQESQENAPRKGRLRMFAAGITNNIIATFAFIGLLLMIGLVISPVSGAAIGSVVDNTPAADSGLSGGDVIISVNGTEITSQEEYTSVINSVEGKTVQITTDDGDSYTIERAVFTSQTVESNFESFSETKITIDSIGGETVSTTNEVDTVLRDSGAYTQSIQTTDGNTVDMPIGGLTTIQSDTVSEHTSKGESIVILSVNDTRTISGEDVQKAVQETTGTLTITYMNESGEISTESVSDFKSDSVVYKGYTGVQFSDVGTVLYPVHTFNILTSPFDEGASLTQWIVIFFFAPFATLAGLEYNFFGFEGVAGEVYTSSIGFDPVIFFIANIFFWTAWININLAVFNCLPTYMLDGGHMLRDGSSLIGEKLGFEGDTFSQATTRTIKMIMLVSLLVMIFAPMIL